MASARDIRRRIKGVRSTGKITRAMEMISAVKMRKAMARVQAIRPYAQSAIDVLHQLTVADRTEKHALLTERPIARQIYVVIASNRGLCGGFNAQIGKKLRQILAEDEGREPAFVTVGKKAEVIVRRFGGEILASFTAELDAPTALNMRPLSNILLEEFQSGRADRVVMIYTDFVSVMAQEVKVRALLPVTEKDTKKAMHEITVARERRDEIGQAESEPPKAEYLIEPGAGPVLERMIPRLLEMELYHAMLESNASQEAARMLAMRNATDAAKDMTADLTLAYNQLRQQKITQEIAELSAGMAAVSK